LKWDGLPANPYPLDFDLDKRVTRMNEHGVQMHVLTLSGGMPWQWATPGQGLRLAQIVNDAAVEAHTAYPDRFVAGIAMPVRDPRIYDYLNYDPDALRFLIGEVGSTAS